MKIRWVDIEAAEETYDDNNYQLESNRRAISYSNVRKSNLIIHFIRHNKYEMVNKLILGITINGGIKMFDEKWNNPQRQFLCLHFMQ